MIMNCSTIQNKILDLPDPRVIPNELLAHVAACEACRVWAKQVARLESLLEQLPVPPAPGNKKAEMIDELAGSDLVIIRPLSVPHRESFGNSILKYLDQNKLVLGGLAAAILVVVGGWWLLNGTGNPGGNMVQAPTPKDPFLNKMVLWDVDLAKAETTSKRLQILGDMADGLSTQTRSLARVANADELRDLARWYDKVVQDGVVGQAKKLPTLTVNERAKRKEDLSALAAKLAEEANLAEKFTEVPPDAKPALQTILKSAREGEKELRKLVNEG